MGIPNLADMNLCLLASWVKRYEQGEGKIWKQIVDYKYRTNSPNIFYCPTSHASLFWKGVMWATQAAKFGYNWKVGNGKKIKFWEDQWFGSFGLAIMFWELYSISNEQGVTIADAWDGVDLKITFRRCVDERLLHQWLDLLSIARSIILVDEDDALIWKLISNGEYTSSSLYAVVNFRGVPQLWFLLFGRSMCRPGFIYSCRCCIP